MAVPLSYAQIREKQKDMGLDHLSTAEFSRLMNKTNRTKDFDQGLTKGLGALVKGASYGIDKVIEPAAEFSSAIGQQLFGDSGAQAFHSLPRMTAEMLPFLRATKLATAGGAGLIAGNVYEKTGDKGAAAIAGGMGLLFPAAQRLGVRALGGSPVRQVEKALVARGAERAIAEGAAARSALTASNEVVKAGGRAFATQLQKEGVVGVGSRLRQLMAAQTGLFAANVASQAAQGVYMNGMEGLKESLSPEHLLVSALAQLPFGVAHLPRSLRGSPQSKAVASYAKTMTEFGPDALRIPQSTSYPAFHEYKRGQEFQQATQGADVRPVPGTVGTPGQPVAASTAATGVPTPAPVQPEYHVGGKKFQAFGHTEKLGDKDHVVGTLEWLRTKGDSQNIAFPTREAGMKWLGENKNELINFGHTKVAGDPMMYVTARAKPLPKPPEAAKGQPAQFYNPPEAKPTPKAVDPQIELALQPAKDALDTLQNPVGVPPVKVENPLPVEPVAAPVEAAKPTEAPVATPKIEPEVLPEPLVEDSGLPSPVVYDSRTEEIQHAPPQVQEQLINHENPEVAVPAAMAIAEVTPAEVQAAMKSREDLPPADAIEEVVTAVKEKAKRVVEKRTRAEAGKVAVEKNSENNAVWWDENQAVFPPEVKAAFIDFAKATGATTQKIEYQSDLFSAFRKWYEGTTRGVKADSTLDALFAKGKNSEYTRDEIETIFTSLKKGDVIVENPNRETTRRFKLTERTENELQLESESGHPSTLTRKEFLRELSRDWFWVERQNSAAQKGGVQGLLDVLKAVKRTAEKPQGDKTSRRSVSRIENGKPIFELRKNLVFETKAEAILALQKMEQQEGFYYSTPRVGKGFVIREEKIIGKAMETKTDKVLDLDEAPDADPFEVKVPQIPELPNTRLATDPVEDAAPPSAVEARAKELRKEAETSTVSDYVARLHESPEGITELEMLGEGSARLGAARLEFALHTFAPERGSQAFFDALAKNKQLFGKPKEALDFIQDAVPHLAAWAKDRVKLLGLQGSEGAPETTLQGELMQLNMLLKSVGLTDPAHYEQAVKLLNLYDTRHLGFAHLQNPESAGGIGAFSINGQGERTIWLAANGTPKLSLFTLAHEVNGHGIWDLYQQGKLDPHTSSRLKEFQDFITENITQSNGTNKVILRELLDMLPGRLKNDKNIKGVIERDELNTEEVISNVNALVSLAMTNSNKGAWNSFMKYMPAPIANGIAAMAKYSRKLFESISGLLWTRDVRQKLTSPERVQMNEYLDTLKSILKVDHANQKAVEDALHLQVASEPGRFGKIALSSEGPMSLLRGEQHEATHDVAKLMSLRELGEKVKNPFRKGSTFWDRTLLLGTQLGQKYKELRYAVTRGVEREANYNKIEFDMLSMYNLVKKGFEWRADPNSAISKVTESPLMGGVRDNIVRRVNKAGYATHMDAVKAMDPEVMVELAKLNPAQQLLVRENLVKFEQVQAAMANTIRDARYNKLVHNVAEQFMHNDSTMARETAVKEAELQVEMLKNGTFTTTGFSDVDLVMNSTKAAVEDFHANASKNLGYVTERRFGEYKAKVEMASGKNHYVDAHSKAEFDMLKADYESGKYGPVKKDGWVDKTKTDTAQFHMSDAVEFLMEKDVHHTNDLNAALIREGIHPDRAREIADQNSFGKDLRNEMALREIADSSGNIARFDKRRFVGGREQQDTMQQQIKFIQNVARGLTKGVAQAEFKAAMASPELKNHPERATVQEMWNNYNKVDPAMVKTMNRVQYNMFMSFHFLNMLQDGAQPLLGSLASNMVNEGGGVVKSHGVIGKAMTNMLSYHLAKKGLKPDEIALIEERRKTNSGLGTFTDETSNDILSLTQARRRQEGREEMSMGQFVKSKLATPFLWGKRLHKHFTDYGQDSALLALYRFYKDKGQTPEQARDNAKQTLPIAMFNAGKAGRAIGIWSGDKLRPVTAAMTGLQTFSLGSIGTLKNMVDRSFLNVPGMTKAEVTSARKALAVSLVGTVAQSGLYGLPFAAAATLILEKVFDVKAREAVASMFKSDDEEDGDEDVMQQVALHGILNTMTGFDIASKNTVSGILGFNGYDGFSWEGMAGPTGQLLKSMLSTAPGELVKDGTALERVGRAATELLPNQIKRAVKFAQNDGEFLNQNKRMLAETTGMEKGVFALLGLKPERIAREQEAESMRRAASEIELVQNREWTIQMAKHMQEGDVVAIQQAIADKVHQDPTLSAEGLAEAITEQYVEMTTPQDPRKGRGASTEINQVMGVRYQGPTEVQRQQTISGLMQDLGFANVKTLAERRRAQKIDQIHQLHPTWSIQDVMKQIRDSSPRTTPQQRRNRVWESRFGE